MERPQYNYDKLRGLIKEHFGTQANFASALGIGTTALTSKLNNQTYFNQIEIEKSANLLCLSNADEINAVFFTQQ